jgi:hypothetical protein
MRALLPTLAFTLIAVPALAAPILAAPVVAAPALGAPVLADPAKAAVHHAPAAGAQTGAPRSIGKFGQWQAATHQVDGAVTCFAFTRAEASAQHIPGRGDVVLSVTRRPKSHDVAALSAGFVLSGHEDAQLQAGATKMLFYIAGRSAFARDNAAAIAAFGQESSVTARLPGPNGVIATDHFSLKGFAGAYAALAQACPTP